MKSAARASSMNLEIGKEISANRKCRKISNTEMPRVSVIWGINPFGETSIESFDLRAIGPQKAGNSQSITCSCFNIYYGRYFMLGYFGKKYAMEK